MRLSAALPAICVVLACSGAFALFGMDETPEIPVGLDAYRQWEDWPLQRIGVRAYMRSTYDRSGGNEGADASHFLYQEAEDFNVTLDVEGPPGVLYFARYNHWHGSPWHYEVDGTRFTIRESSKADPLHPKPGAVFLPEGLLPKPLAWTWADTKGADLVWRPIPFERSFRMAYGRTRYGTGYYIYHLYAPGARLSQPIVSWDGKTPPDKDVLELIGLAGTDIAPKDIPTQTGRVELGKKSSVVLFGEAAGPSKIRALKLSVPREAAIPFGRARLRITWDGRDKASVDTPVCLFFGAGTLYNRDGREYLVKAFPINIRYDEERVHLACYLPMPFFEHARIELTELAPGLEGELAYEIRHEPYAGTRSAVGYLHATYRDHPAPAQGEDLVLLDTRGTEGNNDWSGSFIGTSFIFSHNAVLNTLEGDPRFFLDDCRTPNYGTGTEEWCGGGDYWGGRNMTLPFAGHPCGARKAEEAKNPEDLVQSAYRFLLADLMPFGQRAKIRLEHGGENQSKEHYETVTYWYGLPAASMVLTCELDVGNQKSEGESAYISPDASVPETIHSRFEWGVDHTGELPREVYPAHEETERHMAGFSEFTISLRPDNQGVMLRRAFDYGYPNQRAEVFVADISRMNDGGALEWEPAGVWYAAGSNTCYYSNPRGELDPSKPIVQTSNRRFREDEFLLPCHLTEGRFTLRIRIQHAPKPRPLLPGMEIPESAWSEIRYQTWCFVAPEMPDK